MLILMKNSLKYVDAEVADSNDDDGTGPSLIQFLTVTLLQYFE